MTVEKKIETTVVVSLSEFDFEKITEYLHNEGYGVISEYDDVRDVERELKRAKLEGIVPVQKEDLSAWLEQAIWEMPTEEVQKLYDAILASHHRAHLKDGR